MEAKQILKKIISKGGILGYSALNYKDDEEKAKFFILEMKQQIQHSSLRKFWGKTLTKEIEQFT